MAQEELKKIDKGTVNPATTKLLETVKDELDKGSKEITVRQKKIRMADLSKYSWAMVETYESDDLADSLANEKHMEKAQRERKAAKHLAKKRGQRGQRSFLGTQMQRDVAMQMPRATPDLAVH